MRFLLFLMILTTVATCAFAQTNTGGNKTPRELFLSLPSEIIAAPAAKRAKWIESESTAYGNLSFNVPLKELTGEDGEGSVFGYFQIFSKTGGGLIVGIANNVCTDGECIGLMRFLDFKNGEFTDVSDEYLMIPDNDEVIKILRAAPAFKKPLKDGVQVPLAVQFAGTDKTVMFIAGCVTSCDGGVIAKQFKWNGTAFVEYEDPMSPE